ncbi:molybdate ABC transporter substrate-binding protein [Paraburkholderia bannensis]|uniref:molybdate ABC transporter substrate-binding protein n=1 Tax=Paraburkholderia bannensis TaxID=765414 RepID=UPI002AB6B5E0|nr:substrate-binding domain-containing protein [Paraburkholderia bannensis]
MTLNKLYVSIFSSALLFSAMASQEASAADVHVLATGALSASFKQLVPAFERQTGDHLIISWGPSYGASPDALPMRIEHGEPMDVCFMIGAALDNQIKKGVFVPETKADIAESGVGVAVRPGLPVPDVSSVDKLRAVLLAAHSVAFSEGASGTYITGTLFTRLGIADQMKEKSVLIKGKELVGNALARGDADVGLQQISELRAIPAIQYAGPLPQEVQKVSVISAAIAKDASERAEAQKFVDFVQSHKSQAIIESTGLGIPAAK